MGGGGCEVNDIFGFDFESSGCAPSTGISYLSGIGVIALLLFLVVLLLSVVCCLVCKIRKISR